MTVRDSKEDPLGTIARSLMADDTAKCLQDGVFTNPLYKNFVPFITSLSPTLLVPIQLSGSVSVFKGFLC